MSLCAAAGQAAERATRYSAVRQKQCLGKFTELRATRARQARRSRHTTGADELRRRMNEAVEEEKFEEAAALRDELRALEKEGAKHDEP